MHLASIVTPGKDSTRELEHAVDVDGHPHVLDACLAHGVRRIVVSSSGAAYGYHPDNPEWITEDQPVRGNEEFAYATTSGWSRRCSPSYRDAHPELEQVVLRIGTILGERSTTRSPRCSSGRGCSRSAARTSPFVFIWDTDVVAIIQQAVTGAGRPASSTSPATARMTIDEIAARARQAAR